MSLGQVLPVGGVGGAAEVFLPELLLFYIAKMNVMPRLL